MKNKKVRKKLTQSEYAAHRGITQSTVAKMIQKGWIDGAFEKKGRRYLIDPIKADAVLEVINNPATDTCLTTEIHRPLPSVKDKTALVSFAEASRREKLAKAALLELRLKRENGELIEKKRVQEVASKIATRVRIGIEAIPFKIAPVLAGMSSTPEIARFMQNEFKTVLNDLAKEIADSDY